MSQWQLAQMNIGRARAAMDDPIMHGFVSQLEHINQLAEQSAGFIWRLQTADGDATSIQAYEDPLMIVNMSVWSSLEDLQRYVYSGEHLSILRLRKDWFDKIDGPTQVLWWVPAGYQPSVADGKTALANLAQHGTSAQGFSFAKPAEPPDLPLSASAISSSTALS
jgi:hypothetical protein